MSVPDSDAEETRPSSQRLERLETLTDEAYMAKMKMGRPPLPANEKRDARVTTMVLRETRTQLLRLAKRDGVTLAQLTRRVLCDEVERRS